MPRVGSVTRDHSTLRERGYRQSQFMGYRVSSPTNKYLPLGPYSRISLVPYGGSRGRVVSYESGTPVLANEDSYRPRALWWPLRMVYRYAKSRPRRRPPCASRKDAPNKVMQCSLACTFSSRALMHRAISNARSTPPPISPHGDYGRILGWSCGGKGGGGLLAFVRLQCQ